MLTMWQKNIKEQVFSDLDEERVEQILTNLEFLLLSNIKDYAKVWATQSYYETLIFNMLVTLPQVKNKKGLFLATLCKNLCFEDSNINAAPINIKTCLLFNEQNNLGIKPSVLLSLLKAEEYSDVVSRNDQDFFNDLILMNNPHEVETGVYGLILQNNVFSYKFRDKKSIPKYDVEQLKALIPSILMQLTKNVAYMRTSLVKEMYSTSLRSILQAHTKFKVTNKK